MMVSHIAVQLYWHEYLLTTDSGSSITIIGAVIGVIVVLLIVVIIVVVIIIMWVDGTAQLNR